MFVYFLFVFLLMASPSGLKWVQLHPHPLILAHWGDVRAAAHNNNVNIKKDKWITFCSSEWPTFNVRWPSGGSFLLDLITKVEKIVFRARTGYTDEIPYTITWRGLIDQMDRSLPWVRPCLPPSVPSGPLSSQVFPIKKEAAKPILQGGTEADTIQPLIYSLPSP